MQIIAVAYTLEDVMFLKDFPIDTIRFGEPDCYLRAIKNWPEKNIEEAIKILKSKNKNFQFQFLNSPAGKEEINYLLKISQKFPFLTVIIETYGFLSRIKNKKVAGTNLAVYNKQCLKMLKKSGILSINLPINVKEEDVRNLKHATQSEGHEIELEYCFFGKDKLLFSWQCFLKHLISKQPVETQNFASLQCSNICNGKELILKDKNNSNIEFSILGNTVVSSSSLDRIHLLKKYLNAGITTIILDFHEKNSNNIVEIITRIRKFIEESDCENKKED